MAEPGPWTTRLCWLVLPLTVGPALAAALEPRLAEIRTLVSVVAWLGWGAGLVATLVPRTVSLTVVRVVAPAAAALAVWAALAAPADEVATWLRVLAVASAGAAAAAALSPLTADAFVDGSSYGPERRLTLRAPAVVLLGAGPLAWAVAVAGAAAGPLLLATGSWAVGLALVVAGWPLAWWSVRALHGLARRWLVFVPAGVVVHDPLTLGDPILVPRRRIVRLGPATTTDGALDLTQRAPGLPLALDLAEPLTVAMRTGRRRLGNVEADRLLLTPNRAAEVLREAAARRLPVG